MSVSLKGLILPVIVVILAAWLLTRDVSHPAQAQTMQVAIKNFSFEPADLTVAPGTTVTWTNQDPVGHTSTSDTNIWSSPVLNQGQTYSYTFNQPGTFPYYCIIHTYMKGTIVVQAAGGGLSPTSTSVPPPSNTPVSVPTVTPASSPTPPAPTATATSTPLPPTSTVTPLAPKFPDPATLLKRSVTAFEAVNTYRVDEQVSVKATRGGTTHLRVTGDVAQKTRAERLRVTVQAPGRRTATEHLVEIKNAAWINDASTGNRWRKVSPRSVRTIQRWLTNPLYRIPALASVNLVTVGPETYNGIAVWHVRGGAATRFDALIGRQGFLPYLTTRSFKSARPAASVTDRLARTRFGERLTVNPPRN